MNSKEYKLPNGKTAVFEYDDNGIGKITLEAMDYLLGTMTGDLISRCELLNRLATIPAPPEANDFKAEIYKVEKANIFQRVIQAIESSASGLVEYLS